MDWNIFRFARDFGRYGILDTQKKVWFFRILIIVVIVFAIIRAVGSSASALTVSTYSNTFSTGTAANNLLTLIPENNYYVVFTSSDSTYIFYSVSKSDFLINGSSISASHIKSIRQSSSGYTGTVYSFDDDDDLNLTVNHIVASNLDFKEASKSYNYSSDSFQDRVKLILLVFLPILIFSNLKGRAHNEYN